MNTINDLKLTIGSRLPFITIYGEGRQIRQDSLPGVVYVNADNMPCAVNNNRDGVLFWVKNGSEKAPDAGFGNKSAKRKITNYTLIASSKRDISAELLNIVNDLEGFEWSSESFAQNDIGSEYFGLNQVNLETYFYTLEFTVIETVDCKGCRNY